MFPISDAAITAIDTLESHGFEAYCVGGAVRDLLMGKVPTDYDITTNALPQDVINIFPKTVATGIKHGTITVLLDKETIEITTYRTDGEYVDNRHPEKVQFVAGIGEDLSRRDFTVNAIAYSPYRGILDLLGGRKDIKNKIIKCVGQPEKRFNEDALRIMRCFRFASTLGFSIEKHTLCAAVSLI
ncbi:MAG: hypothetical protein IIW23_02885, partial [Clostridia bacterium]|nr:hypothetical protein [Clostridia bacterium]